jgi:hypothetical protein
MMDNLPKTINVDNYKPSDIDVLGTEPRIFVIPDIHGEFALLKKIVDFLITVAKLDLTRDKLIFLGDMIDRGPQSNKVLEFIMYLQLDHPDNVVALIGNHEDMCLDAHRTGLYSDFKYWGDNGGNETLKSFPGDIPAHILSWLGKLKDRHEEPGFFFSHAPVRDEGCRNYDLQGKPFTHYELTWTKCNKHTARHFGKVPGEADAVGVCGHVHAYQTYPRILDHYIFADAGCGTIQRAPLVAIEVKTRVVVAAYPPTKEEPKTKHLCTLCWQDGGVWFCVACSNGYHCAECKSEHMCPASMEGIGHYVRECKACGSNFEVSCQNPLCNQLPPT